jgi:transcriptional regulator CtsR
MCIKATIDNPSKIIEQVITSLLNYFEIGSVGISRSRISNYFNSFKSLVNILILDY